MSPNIYTQSISEFCKELDPNFDARTFWTEEIDPSYYEEGGKPVSGENHWNYGLKHTEEHKRKVSEAKKGYTHSSETRKKLSELKKGYTHKPESIQKMRETQTGVRISEETKRKISESTKRMWAERREEILIKRKQTREK